MPPRQGHRKSRAGCDRCKHRKVKCDEKRPVCSGCIRYPEACVYTTGRQKLKKGNRLMQSGSDSDLLKTAWPPTDPERLIIPYLDIPISEINLNRRRRLELLLLHTFETSTIKTFPGYRTPPFACKRLIDCVHVALEHDCLLHTIFAVAALHLTLVPSNHTGENHNFDFERVHQIYFNMAIREQREAVSVLSEQNAGAVCWTAIMMSYIAINLVFQSPEAYIVPFQWLSMSFAISTIYRATMQWRDSSGTLEYMTRTGAPDFRDDSQCYDYNYGKPFRDILSFDDGTDVLDDATSKIYDKALAYVAKSHSALTVDREEFGRFCRRCLAFAPMIGVGFVTLVGEERPRALAILAYFCAMVKSVDGAWFFKGVAQRELSGISKTLPPNWQWAMEWPWALFATIEPLDCEFREEEVEGWSVP